MNPMRQPPAYEELDLEGQDSDTPLAPEPGLARGTRPSVFAGLLLHYVQVPTNLRAQAWYWFVAIPRAMAWIAAFVLLLSTLQILSQQEPRCNNLHVPCPITEAVLVPAPCSFCNVAHGVLAVERSNHSVLQGPQCSSPEVIQILPHEMTYYHSIKEFECCSDIGNVSYRIVTLSFRVWYLEDRAARYDHSTYNARILYALAFTCSDNASSPSTLEVQIDRRVYQKEQPWLASENIIWNRLFITSKPAQGFAVLP